MPFTIKDQCTIDIKIAGYQNFFDENTLLRFIIKEEAGNVLPTWEMDFFIDDSELKNNDGTGSGRSKLEILKSLNEGSIITAALGDGGTIPKTDKMDETSGADASSFPLYITELNFSYEKYPYIKVYMAGIGGSNTYTTKQIIKIIKQKSSIDAIKEVAALDFSLNINSEIITKDIQNWVQYNVSNREFIQNILMHSYVSDDDFLCSNIGIDGTFTVASFKNILKKITPDNKNQQAKEKFKYTFTNKTSSDDDSNKNNNLIPYSNIVVAQANGLINKLAGYEPNGIVHMFETATDNNTNISLKNKISENEKLNRTNKIDKIATSTRIINDNVHEKYWDTYYNNVSNLLVRGTTIVGLTFQRRYLSDLKVLDPVQVLLNSMKNSATKTAEVSTSDFESGFYIVSKIVRCYMNKNVSTSVYCSRENLNNQVGDFK